MTTYKLTFNIKSKSVKIPQAIKLAKTSFSKSLTETDKSISIQSNECNRSFKSILRSVMKIKGTTLELNDKPVADIIQFVDIMECDNKRTCKGICTVIGDYNFQLEFLGVTPKDRSAFYNSARWEMIEHDDAIEECTSTYLVLNRDKFQQHYLEDTESAKEICPKYDLALITSSFDVLPKQIKIELTPDCDSILERFMDAPQVVQSDDEAGEMVVDLSRKTIEDLADEIVKKLSVLLEAKADKD